MATEKQIAANRANALKSTGPRTPAGKTRAVRNAFSLGLTTGQLLAPTESRGTLARHAAALRAHFAPSAPIEALLVDRVIAASWRLRRARIIETRVYHQLFHRLKPWPNRKRKHPHDPLAQVFRFAVDENSLQRLSLDEARQERSLYCALREINSLRIDLNRNKSKTKNPQIEPNLNLTQPHESLHLVPPTRHSKSNPIKPNE